jgi:hypothetical protein
VGKRQGKMKVVRKNGRGSGKEVWEGMGKGRVVREGEMG